MNDDLTHATWGNDIRRHLRYNTSSDRCIKTVHLHTRTARTLTWLASHTPIRHTRHARFLNAAAAIHELIYHPHPTP